jgi:hypothetical protein
MSVFGCSRISVTTVHGSAVAASAFDSAAAVPSGILQPDRLITSIVTSLGFLDLNSHREIDDLCECIEWAGHQDWSNKKVGLSGISYYAANQWRAAARRPKYLSAICVWEGFVNSYRDATHHGGILCTFAKNWNDMQIKTVQHGLGTSGPISRMTGEPVCGPDTLSEQDLVSNRANQWNDLRSHPLDDQYYRTKQPDLEAIDVPLLSAGNWGGHGLHLRGNIEGYTRAGSRQKWLEIHGGSHWVEYYTDYGLGLQKRFFGHFLKGEATGWDSQPRVQLQIRSPGEQFCTRHEHEWPIARTQWTRFFLDPHNLSLGNTPSAIARTLEYDAMGAGLTFSTPRLSRPMEVTGPCAAKLFLSSSTVDADVFLVLRVFDPDDNEALFRGALDPKAPVAQGWLRASHRKIDPEQSTFYRPYHSHDEFLPLVPHQPVELDVEIWPTSIVIPEGFRLALTILGRDYEHDTLAATLSNMKNPMKGCGPFVHDDDNDRPPEVFAGRYTLHFGAEESPFLLLPVIPERS